MNFVPKLKCSADQAFGGRFMIIHSVPKLKYLVD